VEGVRKGYRHQVLLGATGTGKSVVGEKPVWLWVDEMRSCAFRPIVVEIGPYVEALFARYAPFVVREGEHEILPTAHLPQRFATPAFSPRGELGLFPVAAFTRHGNRESLFQVTTRCGRQVTVTGGHNFWVLRKGEWVLTTTEDLTPDDFLPLPTLVPPPEVPLDSLDLLEDLQGAPLFVEAPETVARFLERHRPVELARMVEAGEDPKFIARRMVIFASEDIGMAQPTALVVANEVFRAVETIGYPECAINLAHGVVYLATARKDRAAYEGLRAAQADVKRYGNLPIPLNLRNAPTRLMKALGYGKGYQKYSREDLLPDRLRGRRYYRPK